MNRPWLRAAAWLALLGPVFFLTYNFTNAVASHRAHVGELMFPWERHIPFLAWTILPYWLSDVFYAASLWICTTREELDLHGRRLLAIQAFSIACFLAFPLQCTFDPPPMSGWESQMFAGLLRFDRPYNQAPSLHVALAVILWMRYRAHASGLLRAGLAACFAMVAASTLTTHRHHFIDLLTGVWAGVMVVAALPERRVASAQIRLTWLYLAGAAACTAAAFIVQGPGWLLLWPGFGLSMVAAAYWTGDPAWLRNPTALLMWPYTTAAWINSRLWTHGEQANNHLIDAVWIGRAPSRRGRAGMNSVVGLAPELPVRSEAHIPMLDLIPPSDAQLDAAVQAIMRLQDRRPTLVCCALGYSRSAVTSAAWLMAAGHAETVEDALVQVKRARPQIVVGRTFTLRLQEWAGRRNAS